MKDVICNLTSSGSSKLVRSVLYCIELTVLHRTVLYCTDLLGVCEVGQGVEGEGAEDGEQGEQAAGPQHRPGVPGQQPHVPAHSNTVSNIISWI